MAQLKYILEEDYKFSELGRRYYHTAEVIDATSEPVGLPNNTQPIVVHVTPETSATVQYTFAPYRVIERDEADWIDWPLGAVTELTVDSAIGNISALRLVAVGTATWEIVI